MSNPEITRDKGQGPVGFTRGKQTTEGPLGLGDKFEPKRRWVAQLNPVNKEKPSSPPKPASKLIPDLDEDVVDHILETIRFLIKRKWRQEFIDLMVKNRKRKGIKFDIMQNGKPQYLEKYPSWIPENRRSSNGITLRPSQAEVCTGGKPCVFIFPTAFAGSTKEESVVRLYSAIVHEHRHATQWQDAENAKKLGKMGRELDAFLWEIENQKRTGLSSQPSAKANVWKEAEDAWKAFKGSEEWESLSEEERKKFVSRYNSVKTIATK